MQKIDITQMQRVGGSLGSNPAGIFQDQQGHSYYVKTLESVAHARNEYIAASLYQLAGAPTLSYVKTTNPIQVATKWLNLEKKSIAHFTQVERQQAQQWLAVHAWTANWDAAGLHGDNQGVYQNTVVTLDVGGALAFRAHGDPKGKAFGSIVTELDTLRTDKDNPHAIKLFADMSEQAVLGSIRLVRGLQESEISETILLNEGSTKLRDKMLARRESLSAYAPES